MAQGRQKKMKNGLTRKENAFTQKLLEQVKNGESPNATEAAIQVYDTKNRATAGQIGHEILKKPEVKEQLEQALESEGLSMNVIMQEMKKIAVSEPVKITGDVKLRSLVELLKLTGAYPSNKSAHINLNLRGKIGNVSFEEAKALHDKMSAEVGELVGDTETTP